MKDDDAVQFPSGFLWGAATAAYQIEGQTRADGRGESIWDVFARNGGAHNGDTAEIAADHYRRYRADHALAKEFGLGALRLSIGWPRISPTGSGQLNEAGFDHYSRVIDSVLEHDLIPFVTLYHWDLPQALQENGGWLNRDTAYRFADYAQRVANRYGDRVRNWLTVNEPWTCAFLGHAQGLHAPGMTDYAAAGVAAHHLMLAHGLATASIRATSRDSAIGIPLSAQVVEPFSASPEDVAAARLVEAETNGLFLGSLLSGSYPEELFPLLPALDDASVVRAGDLKTISAPIDYLGLNYYVHELIQQDRTVPGLGARRLAPPGPRNVLGSALRPEGIEQVLLKPLRDYGSNVPIFVTEVGNTFNDYVTPEGMVRDPERIAYYDTAFRAVASAMRNGVDVRGIFVWTLIDDFEWAAGYLARFGIIYVDFPSQKRIPKASAFWLRDAAVRGGLVRRER